MTIARSDDETPERVADQAVEQVIGRLLQIGVTIAAVVVLAGGAGLLGRNGGEPTDFHTFRGATAPFRDLSAIARGVCHLDSRAIVQLGLVLLIATPVARVALTLIVFVIRRDRLYSVLTLIVFVLLIVGLAGGRG